MAQTLYSALKVVTAGEPLLLDVRDFNVRAEMNRPYEVEVTAASREPALDLDALVGLPATFALTRTVLAELETLLCGGDVTEAQLVEAGVRSWSGIVAEIRQVSMEDKGLSYYRLKLVPHLWLLTQQTNTRIFQHLSELEVVEKVLAMWRIESTLYVDRGAHRRREYRTQYEETDFDFVNRMLEEAGVSYYFESGNGRDGRMVITDAPNRQKVRDGLLVFEDEPMDAEGVEWATGVELVRRVAPGKVSLVDHDFRRAPNVPILAVAQAGGAVEQQLDVFEYRDGHFLYVAGDAGDVQDPGDKRGPARTDEREAQVLAQKRLRALRARARETRFETNAWDVDVGDVVRIDGHASRDNATVGILVTEVTLSGGPSRKGYLEALGPSAGEVYRPVLRTPRPIASGVESAVVVGPNSNKSHKDRYGRIFVHFHWDRDELADEFTSCWMHVSQPWSGASYGGAMMPRPGQEVIVSFFGSDPDRPVVTGRYHTAIQKPLFDNLTDDEEGGMISQSTDGSGGSNQVKWKDKGGQEMLSLQAQRDKQVLVKRNSGTTVRSNSNLVVGNNRGMKIKGVETKKVDSSQSNSIGDSQGTTVQKSSFLQSNDGALVNNANTAITFTSQGAVTQCSVVDRIVVGGSAIVLTPSLIMINSPKVLINPGEADAKSIIETGMTAADAATARRQAENQKAAEEEKGKIAERTGELNKRQEEVNQLPLMSKERQDKQSQIDRERKEIERRQQNLDSPIFSQRQFNNDAMPKVFDFDKPLPQTETLPSSVPQTPKNVPPTPRIQDNPFIFPSETNPSVLPVYQPRPFPFTPN